jgi:pimeloyl-ACP methyl ester carboxylesterase
LVLPLIAVSSRAQSAVRIDSQGSEIVLTVWRGDASAAAAVLLVPGWGGGPADVLGIADFLSGYGVPTVVVTPRGWHDSEGRYTFAGALQDIGAALGWVRREMGAPVVLGGHSWGGGMSLAYAAQDSTVRRVFSVAGTDHGLFMRRFDADTAYAETMRGVLEGSVTPPDGIRATVDETLDELRRGQTVFGLMENAAALADRSVLLIGGWEDRSVTVDDTLLPLYRALRRAGAEDVTFKVYHTGHGFGPVRDDLHRDLLDWIAE